LFQQFFSKTFSLTSISKFPNPRSLSFKALVKIVKISSLESGFNIKTFIRERRGGIISKDGFSVVAPIR